MRAWRFGALAAAGVLSFVLAGSVHADPPLTQRAIEESLTCQCGCGLTVGSCNHLQCGFAVPARKDIAESLARGETGEQIIERYKEKYGEKVLSSPVAEGFNILAWVAPYLGILVAGVLMFTFFRRRASRGPAEPPAESQPIDAPTDARVARLQQEVEDLRR